MVMTKGHQSLFQGQGAAYRVASELLFRGLNAWFPAVDLGADILTDGGIRIQVKSTRVRRHVAQQQGAYVFNLCYGGHRAGRPPRNFSKECDFVILFGVDESRFWVVPAATLDGYSTVAIAPIPGNIEFNTEIAQRLHAEGKSYRQIARQFGISTWCVWSRLTKERAVCLTQYVLEGENRWDLIVSAIETMQEANQAIQTQEAPIASGQN